MSSQERQSEAGVPPPEAAEPAAAPRECPSELWRQFRRERLAMHSTGDKLAAGVMLTFAIVARLRCGVHPTAAEEWHSAAVLLLSIAVMLSADDVSEHQLFGTRSVLVTLLKLAASTAPLFKNFSLAMSQASDATSLAVLLTAITRVLVANHTALLLFLGLSMPQGVLPDALAQLCSLLSLSKMTSALCHTPFMRSSRQSWPVMHFVSSMRACVAYIALAQVLIGVLLPLFIAVRRESKAAVEFGRQHRVPPHDLRLSIFTWLHRATSLQHRLSWVLGAAFPLIFALIASLGWRYLGSIYE
ncbi:hypothetical protein ACK3TF_000881 [Chlorella vulgaris]